MAGCRSLSDVEVTQILTQLTTKRDRCLFVLGIKTGIRISSLLSLKVSDVYQGGAVLSRVKVQRRNTKGKLSSIEMVIHPQAKSYIVDLAQYMRPDEYLFQSRNGKNKALSRHGALKVLKNTFDSIGLIGSQGQLGTHCMRKSFAEKVHKALGSDIYKTQRALGHKSVLSTAAYLHVDQAEIDEAVLAS